MLHVANCVGNAGLIDRGVEYKFYAEGVTPMIGRLYEAINAERVAVADKLGAKVPDLAAWFELTYGVREKHAIRDLPEAHLQCRRSLSGDRHAEIVRAQIRLGGRAGRPHPDERDRRARSACRRRRSMR